MKKTSKKDKICAVVVTYNRKELLKDTLEGLRKQSRRLDATYLIDNASTDGTPEALKKWGYIKEHPPENLTEPWEKHFKNSLGDFIYVRNNINSGGSGGFYEGIKRAHQSKNFDWIWVMDDDVVPDKSCLAELAMGIQENEEAVLFGCLRYYSDKEIEYAECKKINLSNPFRKMLYEIISKNDIVSKYTKIETLPFEGMLIKASAVDKEKYPDKRFFIFGDDTDYCLRLRKYGEIILVNKARLLRKIKPASNNGEVNWKTYYIFRNYLYLELSYGTLPYKISAIAKKIIAMLVFAYKPKILQIRIKSFFGAIKMYFDETK